MSIKTIFNNNNNIKTPMKTQKNDQIPNNPPQAGLPPAV